MKIFRSLQTGFMLLLAACSGPASEGPVTAPQSTLTVFATASLTDAFTEIGRRFEEANPGVTVRFNFAGSHSLRTQIEQGAQVDVFASANLMELDVLVAGNFIGADTSEIFLTNQLVVITPARNLAGLTELAHLARDGVKVILAAQEAPVGNYSQQALEKLDEQLGSGFRAKTLANVVSYENDVKQVVAKIQLGEADAGIVYKSDVVATPGLKKIDIPAKSNIIAQYPLAILSESENVELARAFVAYVLSTEGQAILARWGFSPIK
jgi:molybdate transport system substrate-binding protein